VPNKRNTRKRSVKVALPVSEQEAREALRPLAPIDEQRTHPQIQRYMSLAEIALKTPPAQE